MTLIAEMIITMVLIFGGTKIGEYFEDSVYDILLENGEIIKVKTSISNTYSCPTQCMVNHYHSVIISNQHYDDRYNINYENIEQPLVLNKINILSIYKINSKSEKVEEGGFKKNQIDTKNFIKKINI